MSSQNIAILTLVLNQKLVATYIDSPTSYFSLYSAETWKCRYLARETYHMPPSSFLSLSARPKVVHTPLGAAPPRARLLDTLPACR